MPREPHVHRYDRWRKALSPSYHRPRFGRREVRWPIKSFRVCLFCESLEWSNQAAMKMNHEAKGADDAR